MSSDNERQEPSYWLSLIRQTKSPSRVSEYMGNAVKVSDFTMITPHGAVLMHVAPDDPDHWTVYVVCGRGGIHFSTQGKKYSYGTGGPARDEKLLGKARRAQERNEDYRILREVYDYLLGATDTPEVVRDALRRSMGDTRRMIEEIY